MLSPILLCALATGQVGALADDAVAITSSVSAAEDRRPARLLGSFLRDRTFETYGISAGVSTTAATRFEIQLRFLEARAYTVAVKERGKSVAERSFNRASPAESAFESWVFVRSVFEQSLLGELTQQTPPIQSSTVAASPAPVVVTMAPTTASTSVPTAEKTPGPYAIAGLALGMLDGDLGVGVALQGRMDLGSRMTATLELGYRQSQPLDNLQLIHLPLSAGVGIVLDPSIPIEVGVTGTLDPRIVVGTSGASLGFGVGVGPYGRVRLPFESVDFIGELAMPFGLFRQAYTQANERTVDPLLGIRVGIGVEYRWP